MTGEPPSPPAAEASRLRQLLEEGAGDTPQSEQHVEVERTYLCVRIGNRLYAFPSEFVVEVIAPRAITPVPHTPDYILGVLSSRSRITPVFDLARYVGDVDESRPTRIVVLRSGSLLAGVPVEKIIGIRAYQDLALQPPLPQMRDIGAFIVAHVLEPDATLLVVDVALLLTQARARRARG